METAAGDIQCLPEELLAAVISPASPRDACSAAAVSRTFRATMDSDAVWSSFLPRDLPQLDEFELAPTRAVASKKALYKRLCDQPAQLPCRYISMQLDRVTGSMCYMLNKAPKISANETTERCEWINLGCYDIEGNKRLESFQSAFGTKLK